MKPLFRFSCLMLFTFCIACLCSCHSKQGPINDLADLTEDVKANYENYTEEDWNAFAEEYELIEQELEEYQDQYSDEEKKEIGRLKGKCLAYITKYSVKSFKNSMDNALKEAEGIFEGFSDALNEETNEEE